jgi:chromosome segregation protein
MNELNGMKDELFAISNKAQLGNQRASHLEVEALHLTTQASAAKREIEDLNVRRDAHTEALGELEGQIDRFEDEAAAAREAYLVREREHEQRRGELVEARSLLDRDASVVASGRARIARAEAEKAAAIARKDDLLQRMDALATEEQAAGARVADLSREAEELRASLSELRERVTEAKLSKQDAEQDIAHAKREIGTFEKAWEQVREESHRRRSRLASLSEIQERYESFQKGVRAIMRRKSEDDGAGVRGLVADILQAPTGLEGAVEAVLGERIGHVVVDSSEVGRASVAFLKDQDQGRSTFIPLSPRSQAEVHEADVAGPGVRGRLIDLVQVDDEYRELAGHLLRGVILVDDLAVAEALWRSAEGPGLTFVTIAGEVWDASGSVSGGSRESLGGVLEQKREIRELESLMERLESDTKQAMARVVSAKQSLEDKLAALEELGRLLRNDEMDLLTQQKDLERASEDLNRLQGRKRQLDNQRADLTRSLEDTEERLENASETLSKDGSDVFSAEERVLDLRNRTLSLGEEVDALVSGLSELKVAAAQTQDRRNHAVTTVSRLRTERADFEARVERLTLAIEDHTARAAVSGADSAKLREEAALLQGEAEERARAHGERQGALEERMTMLAGREADLRQLRTEVNRLTQTIARLDLRFQEVTMKRLALEEQMGARYPDITLPSVVYDHHLRPPVSEAEEARTKELRGLLDRMGEINLTAIEESEELQKRFDFLAGQKADLENAMSQLEAAIEKIDKASLKRFRETFEAVNARFQEVFPRLFGGGRAHLSLTDHGDLLETGVEIMANPPGKKVSQNIELMSGGEKALTAVSLLFAIFLVKPSPFCVLDEVDAPLDEANVGRFNDVVREMTDRSQFIIISHNRRTMEIADRLCGITMEEPGVSKLVSVALRNGDTERMAQAKVLTRQDGAADRREQPSA